MLLAFDIDTVFFDHSGNLRADIMRVFETKILQKMPYILLESDLGKKAPHHIIMFAETDVIPHISDTIYVYGNTELKHTRYKSIYSNTAAEMAEKIQNLIYQGV